MKKLIIRKFKSIQNRKPSKDGLKTSIKQYDAYMLFVSGCDPVLLNKQVAYFLIENGYAELKGDERGRDD